jgi:pterin-4a-carbinolamine dehydratase
MKLRQLGSDEVERGLDALDNWTLDPLGRSVHKEWKFDSFRTAMDFLLAVADVA